MLEKVEQSIHHRRPGMTSLPAASPIIHLCGSSSSSSLSSDSLEVVDNSESHLPVFELPQFTIKELLEAIPPHCFERSAFKSGLYVVWDLLLSLLWIYLARFIDPYFDSKHHRLVFSHPILNVLARLTAWALYGYTSSLTWTGLWILAHDCGHQSFSTSKRLNHVVGWFLHSAFLVPYHSWRITHAQHHAATSHLTRDQLFVPKTRSQRGLPLLAPDASKAEREGTLPPSFYDKMDNLLEDAPFWSFLNLILQQLAGWPAYLLANTSGQEGYPSWTNHFNPGAIVFDARHRSQVLISDLGIAITLAGLTFLGYQTSLMTVFKYYIVPYFWVNQWLVMIAYLQHTDPLLPHYRGAAFNFQRGALSTMDRKLHGFFFHGIADNHTVHHICSKIPHYHAWEATAALKAKLGRHYHYTDESCWKSLWKSYTQCQFVEDEGDVVFYKNGKGQAAIRLGPTEGAFL